MALLINSDIAGQTSNSYSSIDEAELYFEERLHSSIWDNSDITTKTKALVTATKRIEQEKFYGERATTTQKLKFPRVGLGYLDGINLDNIIPDVLKEAQFELAVYMIDADMSRKGIEADVAERVKIGSSIDIKFAIDETDNKTIKFNQLPPFVESLLSDISETVNDKCFFHIGR